MAGRPGVEGREHGFGAIHLRLLVLIRWMTSFNTYLPSALANSSCLSPAVGSHITHFYLSCTLGTVGSEEGTRRPPRRGCTRDLESMLPTNGEDIK